MFISVAAVVLTVAVDAVVQPDEWQKHFAENRKKHQPSPQQLAATFREADAARKQAKKEHKAYLKSPEHHAEMVHAGNKMAQKARHQSGDDDSLHASHCGMSMSFANAGYKNTEAVRSIFHLPDSYYEPTSFLQGDPGMSHPGAGVKQVIKDEGRSIVGSVTEAKKGTIVEPYLKVFKDGYSFALCARDKMYEIGDKYGDNKDQYQYGYGGPGLDLNVSIVKYSEIVLKESQKSMSPKVCFQFCRTVPNMVYFGIRSGTDCYCMPFYKKAESHSESCDNPCPGDPSQMCGGKTKSQLFEMHMCADTKGDVLYSAVNAEQELIYMYDTVFMTDKIAIWLDKIGQKLKGIAGAGGDPGAADLAQLAVNEAVSLFDDSTGWGTCRRQYIMLLDLYREAKALYKGTDFSVAENLVKAEDTIMMMDNLKSKLHWCAKRSEKPIVDVYPFYFELMAALDETYFQEALDKFADSLVMYYPALYAMNPMAAPEMSTCTGEPVGKPMAVTLSGCAEACNRQVTPPFRCTAFQYFQIQDGDSLMPLCFLFREIKTIRKYRCNGLSSLTQVKSAFRGRSEVTANETAATGAGHRVSTKQHASTDKTPRKASVNRWMSWIQKVNQLYSEQKAPEMDLCDRVKHAKRFSGMSCEAIFGMRSKVIKACPDECATNQGMKYTALCMSRLSAGVPPSVEVIEGARGVRKCFGSGNGPVDQSESEFRLVEWGKDASGGAGPKIEGDLHLDGTVIKEPYGYVWTPGPAGAR